MKQYQDRDWLYQKYWDEKLSMSQIAKLCKVNDETIRNWMIKFDIKRRTCAGVKGRKNPNAAKRFKKLWKDKSYREQMSKMNAGENNPMYGLRGKNHPAWGYRWSEEAIEKAKKRKFSNETRKKLSLAHKGKKFSKEHIKNISKARKLRVGEKSSNWKGGKIKRKCLICGAIFFSYIGRKGHPGKYCSFACWGIARRGTSCSKKTKKKMSESTKIQMSHPGAKKRLSEISKKRWDNPETRKKMVEAQIIAQNRPEMKKRKSEYMSGEKNPNWLGGVSFEPYGLEFNDKLKAIIRERDNYQCQKCGLKENGKAHGCHHIDYCKQNNEPENLITLCNSCHAKTNFNRQYWQNYFEFQQIKYWQNKEKQKELFA